MIQLTRELLRKIERHAEDTYPEEGVGLIVGEIDGAARLARETLPVLNVCKEDTRHRRYRIHPKEMLQAEETADALEMQIIGVYHSHPDHPPIASETDLRWAVPWYSYLITTVQHGNAAGSRCWQLDEILQTMVEEVIQILPDPEVIK